MHRLLLVSCLFLTGCGPAAIVGLAASGGGGGGGDVTAPAAATGVAVEVVGPQSALVSWVDNADNETGYALRVRPAGESTYTTAAQLGSNTIAHLLNGLSEQTTYEFFVVAINSGGERSSIGVTATTAAALILDRITPDSGATMPGAPVLVRGRGFTETRPGVTLTAQLGGAPIGQLTVLSDTSIRITPPPGISGPADLTIANGYETVTAGDAFTYFTLPATFAPNDQRVTVTPVGAAGSDDPELAGIGSYVYGAWIDRRVGTRSDVFFNRSVDGGASWSPTETRLDSGPLGAGDSRDVELVADGSNVYAVWQDSRNGAPDIYFNRSLDHGATWLAMDVRLDTDAPGAAASLDPEICAIDGRVYVTWNELRDGVNDVYFNCSLDAGTNWLQSDVRINDEQVAMPTNVDPAIACEGDSVYITWMDARNGELDIYFDRSLDNGATWLGNDIRLDTDAPGAAVSNGVEICALGDRVHVVWSDERSGLADIHANSSADRGASWAAIDQRLDRDPAGAALSLSPKICCSAAGVHVAWVDSRSGGSVWCNSSFDDGVSWLPNDRRVDASTVAMLAYGAVVHSTGSHVYVAWTDNRGGAFDVRCNESLDGGVTWRGQDVLLATKLPGSSDCGPPQLCVDGARIYSCWLDARSDPAQLEVRSNRRIP